MYIVTVDMTEQPLDIHCNYPLGGHTFIWFRGVFFFPEDDIRCSHNEDGLGRFGAGYYQAKVPDHLYDKVVEWIKAIPYMVRFTSMHFEDDAPESQSEDIVMSDWHHYVPHEYLLYKKAKKPKSEGNA